MKPALFYSIARESYSEYSRIVAITSEKRGRWFGREVIDNSGTHGRNEVLQGRFETVEAAHALVDKINAINAHHKPLIEAASRAVSDAYGARERAIKEALA